MDLSQLLSPERILCKCEDVHSKKRALQTLAETLSHSLLASAEQEIAQDNEVEEPNSSLSQLASKLLKSRAKSEDETDKVAFSEMGILDAFIARERLGSTCLDHGFALPHSRIALIDQPVAAFITLSEPIDYDAGDKPPVDLILGLLVPEECNDEHLKILATLAKRFSDDNFREEIRSFDRPSALYDYLKTLAPVS